MKINWKQLIVDLWQRFVYTQTPVFHYYFSSSFPISFAPAALDSASLKQARAFLSIISRQSQTSGITFWQLSAILMLMTTNTCIDFLCLSHLHRANTLRLNMYQYFSQIAFCPSHQHWTRKIDKMVNLGQMVTQDQFGIIAQEQFLYMSHGKRSLTFREMAQVAPWRFLGTGWL